jgi:hypothetical protein
VGRLFRASDVSARVSLGFYGIAFNSRKVGKQERRDQIREYAAWFIQQNVGKYFYEGGVNRWWLYEDGKWARCKKQLVIDAIASMCCEANKFLHHKLDNDPSISRHEYGHRLDEIDYVTKRHFILSVLTRVMETYHFSIELRSIVGATLPTEKANV